MSDINKFFPKVSEIIEESKTFDNSMSSMAESVWMPQGFIAGVKWTLEYILKKENENNEEVIK